MNIDFLSPMMLKDSKKLIFMNFSEGKVYDLFPYKVLGGDTEIMLREFDEKKTKEIFEEFNNHRSKNEPEIPIEQIAQVLGTEKDLSQQNEKHIFRRNF